VLAVPGIGEVPLGPDDVVVTETPRAGWAVAREGETVALDLTLTDELRRAGLAREVVRMVQEARKSAGFEVTDRIVLAWEAAGDMAAALREHAAGVAGEVLAVEMVEGLEALPQPEREVRDAELGLTVRISRR
jgi:isoleucyl-tRNA synthetase